MIDTVKPWGAIENNNRNVKILCGLSKIHHFPGGKNLRIQLDE